MGGWKKWYIEVVAPPKNYYRLIAVDLSRQKEIDADPKAI